MSVEVRVEKNAARGCGRTVEIRKLVFRLPVVLFVGLALTTAASLATAAETPQNFIVHETPKPIPEIVFADGEGRALTLGNFQGKVVLLNIWATWCAPCRREMPTLDRLQAELGGSDFEVVALSIDRSGLDVVRKFYAEIGIEHLVNYIDTSARAVRRLNAPGLPTTLLIDREGREIGRLVGPAEWDSPEMVAFLRRFLERRAESSGSRTRSPDRRAEAINDPSGHETAKEIDS